MATCNLYSFVLEKNTRVRLDPSQSIQSKANVS